MSIADVVKPWNGFALSHLPDAETMDARDFKNSALSKTIDLCNLDACKTLSLANPPYCVEEIQVAISTASFLRNKLRIEALFVPSLVFIDDGSKWCLVVFLENLPEDSRLFFSEAIKDGDLEIV